VPPSHIIIESICYAPASANHGSTSQLRLCCTAFAAPECPSRTSSSTVPHLRLVYRHLFSRTVSALVSSSTALFLSFSEILCSIEHHSCLHVPRFCLCSSDHRLCQTRHQQAIEFRGQNLFEALSLLLHTRSALNCPRRTSLTLTSSDIFPGRPQSLLLYTRYYDDVAEKH